VDVDPDDLVQEAFLRILRKGPLRRLDNPGADLRRTIVNIANFGDRIIAFNGDRVFIDRQRSNPALPPIMVGLHLGERAIYTSAGAFSVGVLGDQ
jgi:hypothetical protein